MPSSAQVDFKLSYVMNMITKLRERESELDIVVDLGNLVPRNNLALQKVVIALRYSKS